MKQLVIVFSLLLMLAPGCKDSNPPGRVKKSVPDISLPRDTVYVFELESVKIDKLVGGETSRDEFNFFLHKNQLYVVSSATGRHTFQIGLTAPPASFGLSRYSKVRGRSDHLAVRLPSFDTGLTKVDGTYFHLVFNELRFEAVDEPDAKGVFKEVRARGRGNFSISHGDSRYSGGFDAVWRGEIDTHPPEVTVIPPANGLVSGRFDVFFDKPVEVGQVSERVFLRNAEGKKLPIRVEPVETDFRHYATTLRVETQNLLPFDSQLSLAVGTAFTDLGGRSLTKPSVTTIRTPHLPPVLVGAAHDFRDSRGEEEFSTQGEIEIVETHRGVKPFGGRLLVLTPPKAGRRYSSALITRTLIPNDAEWLQVYVRKIARTRDTHTPCLRYTVAQVTGELWNVECAPQQIPSLMIDTADGEFFSTKWLPISINVHGQRGQEVVLLLEAEPMQPDMPVESEPTFVVDRIRTVPEGQDHMVLEH